MKNIQTNVFLFSLLLYISACKAPQVTTSSPKKEKTIVLYFNENAPENEEYPPSKWYEKPYYLKRENNRNKSILFIFPHEAAIYRHFKKTHKKKYIPKDSLIHYKISKYGEAEGTNKVIDMSRKDSIFIYETEIGALPIICESRV